MFVALALGVVLGSGLLSDTVLSGLRAEKRDLHAQIDTLNDQKNVLNEKLSAANDFAAQMAGRVVHDALTGKSVVVFRTPDAKDDDVEAVSKLMGQAGAAVSGTLRLTQEFVDANSAEKLRSVVNSSIVPAGAQLSTKFVDQGSQAGDLLGIALLINRDPAVPTVDDAQRDVVLAALRDTGFISYPPTRISVRRTRPWSSPAAHWARTPETRASVWRDSLPRWRRTVRVPCWLVARDRPADRLPSP
ncbi:hypothetical protein I553_6641 [Mycobacterium xenopi 4042]|uniref:Channel-forming protein n=1 Tax=Mycobacterium xenopi 4042 TaxID=1299334 RepID=X8BHU9_MYCXE|nr:hypothetical protein I553_6641 [Mycobacterium xenopi 4042]